MYLDNLPKMQEAILKAFPSKVVPQKEAILLFSKLKESGIVGNTLDKNFGEADKMWRSLLKEYNIPNFKLWS